MGRNLRRLVGIVVGSGVIATVTAAFAAAANGL